jgi:uncharacterized membrane protein
MLIPAILFYDVVLFVHVLAVVLAFGVVFTYPMLDAYIRRASPGDLVVLHRFQVFLTRRLITPSMVVVLAAGLYLALDRYSLGDPWISATFTILIVLFGLVGRFSRRRRSAWRSSPRPTAGPVPASRARPTRRRRASSRPSAGWRSCSSSSRSSS